MADSRSFLEKYFDLPDGASLGQEINVILNFWHDPCHAPWSVYAKTLWPVLGHMILVLVEPDMQNIIGNYFRPRSAYGRGYRRTKGRRRSPFRGIPSIDDMLAGLIPGKDYFHNRNPGDGINHLWRAFGVIERLGWNFMLISTALDGAYWWATAIQSTKYCQLQGQSAAEAEDAAHTIVAAGGSYIIWNDWSEVFSGGGVTVHTFGFSVPAGHWQFWCAMELKNIFTGPGGVDCRLRTGGGTIIAQRHVNLAGLGTGSLDIAGSISGPTTVMIDTRPTGATNVVEASDAFFYAIPG